MHGLDGPPGERPNVRRATRIPILQLTRAAGRRLGSDLGWLFASALAFGTLLKLLIAVSPRLGRLDSDRAVVFLAAQHASHGDFRIWFWGQEYGGALFADALGVVFAVTGPHLWMLSAAMVFVSTLVPILTWRIGVRLGFPAHGAIAGALVAAGPPAALYVGVSSEAFYNLGLALSLGGLLAAVGPGRPSCRDLPSGPHRSVSSPPCQH